MANINKIRLSGTTYNIEDQNAAKSVTLTQAEYDALVTKDPNTFYIISDSTIDYVTSAETQSAITQAVSGKQDTLVSGTNIKTINNESILGSGNITIEGGGGASYSAGTGIDITNDVISVTGKVDTTTYETYTAATATAIGDKLATSDFNTYSGTVDTAINSKASQSDLNTLSGTVTAHTANTDIHVTTAQTAAWNAKSDFSGSYNDLTNKPSIPSKTSDLTNDSDFATSGYVDSVVSGKANSSDVYTKSQTSGATEIATALSGKQDTLSAGTNITIVDNVISAEGGGGKAITAGRGITVTSGETADTVSFNLPISAGTGTNSIKCGETDDASGSDSFAIGANGVKAKGQCSFAGGSYSEAKGFSSMAFGRYNTTNNYGEVALGFFNKSNGSSSAAGNSSGNTLFSVGNGTNSTSSTRHNAFEIRQNGDIYCSDGTNDVKLQDTITATSANTTALGGLKLVKLSQSEYDSLATKDNSTLYVIVN